MEKLTIQCEIVTPLLMHGVDGKTPELREQSFKGVMRFWWRAIHGNLSLKELKEKEAMIFGNTEKKSSFRMKLINNNLNIDEFNPLPHKNSNFRIKGFSTNQTFEIEFFGRNLDLVKDIFILSTILGGFGQRSRRGFGVIQVIDNIDKSYVYNLIKEINPNCSFRSNLKYPYLKSIEISEIGEKGEKDVYKLLKRIGEATHNYPYFGSANPRFASPLWVSIIRKDGFFYPVVSELNSPIFCCKKIMNKKEEFRNKEENEKTEICVKYLQEFKKAIL